MNVPKAKKAKEDNLEKYVYSPGVDIRINVTRRTIL